MRNAVTIAVIGAAVAAAVSLFGGSKPDAVAQAQPAPAYQILTIPQYERGPRIIHVPQPGDEERASVNERYEPELTNDGDTDQPAPPPKPRRAAVKPTPKPQRRSDAPPPRLLGPQRAILSAPPPSLAEGPSPVRPTPRYRINSEPGDKFGAPSEPLATPPD